MKPSVRMALLASSAIALLIAAMQPATGDPAPDPTIVAVGDIACQSLSQGDGEGACRSDEVAALITQLDPDRFLALGDLQYNDGKLSEFERVWDVQFGHLRDVLAPVPGNHEYGTADAQGYFDYFGAIAHPPTGYYSFDLRDWHIVALNSEICGDDPGCGPGSPQYEWLKRDLRRSRGAVCTLAFQHHPRWDWRPWQKWIVDDGTTQYGGSETEPYVEMWKLIAGAGVDVMLVGHNHLYQRWAPQDADGNRSPTGVRQFTVGTGGRSLYSLGTGGQPTNLVVTQNKSYGILEMTLHADSYDYRWVSVPGEPAFSDGGSADCH